MKSRYIIFADDDADDLELITGFFKQYNRNVHVLEFRDGKEVIQFLDDFAVNTSAPLLIVLDINMPRMNGKEALIAIRSRPGFRNVPVLIYTTSTNEADKKFCEQYLATWMNKPHGIEDVKQVAKIISGFCQL
ncbi:MAG TPA: response regulator [Flavisolibacter sp.]|jgi:CheY-like chemotaxis protein|nr:response regulator [Flavisolibacter sp.]